MKRQVIAVTLLTFIAQLTAFGKIWLVARYFGVSAELDGYYLAFLLPTVVSGVLGGVLQSGLFPVYAHLRAQRGEVAVERLERALLLGICGFALGFSVLLAIISPFIGGLIAQDAPPTVLKATIFALPFAASTIPLYGAEQILASFLALRGRYTLAAAAPIANALVGATLLVAWPEGGLLNLALGTVVGLIAQVFVVSRAAQAAGCRPWKRPPPISEVRAEMAEITKLGGWAIPGLIFANVTLALPHVLVSGFGEGAVSAFGYAFRFHLSVIQLLAMAASPIILARFGELVARGEHEALRALLHRGLILSVLVGAGFLGFVAFLGEPLLLAIFSHGQFDAEAAARVATHWMWMTLGLFPAVWGIVLTKYLQAARRSELVTLGWFLGLVGLWVGSQWSRGTFAEFSVSVGVAASAYLSCLAYWLSCVCSRRHHRARQIFGTPDRKTHETVKDLKSFSE